MIYGYDPQDDFVIIKEGGFEFSATYTEFEEMMANIKSIREKAEKKPMMTIPGFEDVEEAMDDWYKKE